MNESFKPETPAEATARYRSEFREYLVREHGITDSSELDLAMALFAYSVTETAIRYGLIKGDPIEAASKELIALGVSDEERKAILHRLYQDLEDPRPAA